MINQDDPGLAPHLLAPRILFYAVDGLGLGHVTRLLAIARAIRVRRPAAQFLFLTTSEADNVIYQEGFSSVKLPSRSAIVHTGMRPRVFNKLTHTVVGAAVAAFNPAIMVVDTFPAGASQELLSTLTWEMRRVFVYREQQAERTAEPFFQSALAAYDLCLIPHSAGTAAVIVPEHVPQIWTGEIFIRSRSEAFGREIARKALGLPLDDKVLYVTFGGGGQQEINAALSTTLVAADGLGWTIAVAEAPLAPPPATGSSSNVVVRVRHYPMAECFAAFDAAVSAGGYNTVNELLHFGIPSIVIPFARSLDDQFARVERLSSLGAVMTGELNWVTLRRQMQQLAEPEKARALGVRAASLMEDSGADRAAIGILGLL